MEQHADNMEGWGGAGRGGGIAVAVSEILSETTPTGDKKPSSKQNQFDKTGRFMVKC